MKVVIASIALLSSLALVAWRQGRALEALQALAEVQQERSLAEAERAEMERRIESLESRAHVVPAARERLGMHTPDAGEIVFVPGGES